MSMRQAWAAMTRCMCGVTSSSPPQGAYAFSELNTWMRPSSSSWRFTGSLAYMGKSWVNSLRWLSVSLS